MSPMPDECPDCSALREMGGMNTRFVVTPWAGGGWAMWANALARHLAVLAAGPTRAVIIEQPTTNQRYVQMQTGHGIAYVQASGNVYLDGPSRLTPRHEHLLGSIGWAPPALPIDNPEHMPANWSLPVVRGDWFGLTDVILATIAVFDFDETQPVTIDGFLVDRPCEACSWDVVDDPLERMFHD